MPPAAFKISVGGGHSTTPTWFVGSQDTRSTTCGVETRNALNTDGTITVRAIGTLYSLSLQVYLLKVGDYGLVVHDMKHVA